MSPLNFGNWTRCKKVYFNSPCTLTIGWARSPRQTLKFEDFIIWHYIYGNNLTPLIHCLKSLFLCFYIYTSLGRRGWPLTICSFICRYRLILPSFACAWICYWPALFRHLQLRLILLTYYFITRMRTPDTHNCRTLTRASRCQSSYRPIIKASYVFRRLLKLCLLHAGCFISMFKCGSTKQHSADCKLSLKNDQSTIACSSCAAARRTFAKGRTLTLWLSNCRTRWTISCILCIPRLRKVAIDDVQLKCV